MRRIVWVCLILLSLWGHAWASDMQQYLQDTHRLVHEGKHQEALERYVWFHNNVLSHEPAMYGVRLSYALNDWYALGEIYPPAQKAFIETRDQKTQRLERGEGGFSLFHDVVALNSTLDEPEKTVDLFAHLDQTHPKLAARCWDIAKENVIAHERYDLAKKYIKDPLKEFDQIKEVYLSNRRLFKSLNGKGEELISFNENKFVNDSLQLIHLSVALGKANEAKKVQKMAQEVLNDPRLENVMKPE